MNERGRFYVHHALECIERIENYTIDGRDSFFLDRLIQDGVIRNLQVLAESTMNPKQPADRRTILSSMSCLAAH